MLTQLPKTARDVLATATWDKGAPRLLEIAILRFLEVGKVFAVADELAVPFYGGVIHSRHCYFLLSHDAFVRFPTESGQFFLAEEDDSHYIGVRHGEIVRTFTVGVAHDSAIDRTWIYDVPVLTLLALVERLLRHGTYYLAAVVTLIRRQRLDETFTGQLNSAFHAAYLDCLNEVRQEAAYERG